MGKTLKEIAQELKDNNKKVQLIYAFNGNGKTRLSREFKALVSPKIEIDQEETEDAGLENKKILYYNAFTEVIFSYKRGNNSIANNIKVSKGEESCFIWSVFYALLEQVVSVLNVVEESDRETNQFDNLNYIFIDDPVTSLDDNHLIQMAVDLAEVIRKSESELKFIITTHNPIFYNVLYNEINKKKCYMLERLEDGTFDLSEKKSDSNKNFSYHLHLKAILEEAVANDNIEKFHFTLLRNLYEKTASFLGFPRWSELLPENKEAYYNRIIQFTSHSTLANEIVAEPTPQEKQTVKLLLEHLINNYGFWKEE